jgi:hypothetical protein
MALKNINIFPKFTQIGTFGLKEIHLATQEFLVAVERRTMSTIFLLGCCAAKQHLSRFQSFVFECLDFTLPLSSSVWETKPGLPEF